MKQFLFVLLLIFCATAIDITIDVEKGQKKISPALYGRNNCLSINSWEETTEQDKELYRDAGVRLMRENGGNNGSKYNWKNRLSSHPNWYNNVYNNDWDTQAVMIEKEFDNVQGMFAFPLIDWVAKTNANNFDEGTHDPSHSKKEQNLCGEGDISRYLTPWGVDSSAEILEHWFGDNGLGLSKENFIYWNLDNEPEMWDGTHDDVFTEKVHPDTVIEKYLAMAKAVKAIDPGIKLCGPAFTNEWQWWAWGREELNGTPWIEYFIKRFGEESKKTGIQLIDIIDYHYYGDYENSAEGKTEFLQFHRIWYDETYAYPNANGVKTSEGGWNKSLNKEYVLKRTEAWIDQYFPEDNTVTLGVSETGMHGSVPNPNYVALWYASQLGTFADHGTELFSPWFWYEGMWEVMHLFSNYHFDTRVLSSSSNDSLVSAYSALNTTKDSLSIMLLNRDETKKQHISIKLQNAAYKIGTATLQRLANLPDEETFKSATNNALITSSTTIEDDSLLTVELPPLSITRVAVPIEYENSTIVKKLLNKTDLLSFTQEKSKLIIKGLTTNATVRVSNLRGQQLISQVVSPQMNTLTLPTLSQEVYLLQAITTNGQEKSQLFMTE